MTTMKWGQVGTRCMALLATAVLGVALTACQGSSPASGAASGGVAGVDDGATLTMWTRSPTSLFSQTLIDAYNAGHKNKVTLTVIPADSYQQKVASAAGAKQLPDILAADVVYAPNYASKGLFADITARVDALPFKSSLAPAHMKTATYQGKTFGVPHDIDLSALFFNKVLFTKAGLDPNKPPTTLTELYDDAAKIAALGGNTKGYFFGGACPGCMLFTTWPMIWASGGSVLNDQGTASTIDNTHATQVYDLYRKMVANGVVSGAVKNESGTTWTQSFFEGNVGIQPMGATVLQAAKEDATLQIGVAPIPGLDGKSSSFVGGDVLGISSTSSKANQAWDFISWTLSDAAQIDVVAKNKNITARSDLASNKYAQQDPRLQTFNKLAAEGQTPISVNFGQTYNDPNGPWTKAITDVLFGTAPVRDALASNNSSITSSLSSGG